MLWLRNLISPVAMSVIRSLPTSMLTYSENDTISLRESTSLSPVLLSPEKRMDILPHLSGILSRALRLNHRLQGFRQLAIMDQSAPAELYKGATKSAKKNAKRTARRKANRDAPPGAFRMVVAQRTGGLVLLFKKCFFFSSFVRKSLLFSFFLVFHTAEDEVDRDHVFGLLCGSQPHVFDVCMSIISSR